MFKYATIAAVGCMAFLAAAPAAADGGIDDLNRLLTTDPQAGAPTPDPAATDDGTLRLTPNKNKIIHLEQDAASVIVTNPVHASVMLDTPRLMIVQPRQPGTTEMIVLNNKGETILQKDIIVTAGAKPSYVRIRNICGDSGGACTPASYFYCPDGCYEISTVGANPDGGGEIPAIAGGAAALNADGTPMSDSNPESTLTPTVSTPPPATEEQ